MDSALIGKIQKAKRYAEEKNRIHFVEFSVTFDSTKNPHIVKYQNGLLSCDCEFFQIDGRCAHTMAVEIILEGMCELEAVPASVASVSRGSSRKPTAQAHHIYSAREIYGSDISGQPEQPKQEKRDDQVSLNLAEGKMEKTNELVLIFPDTLEDKSLSPEILYEKVAPFLVAISKLQALLDEIQDKKPQEIRVRGITQNSPVSVNLDGGGEAIKVIKEVVVPWRREHAKKMAHFEETEKLAQIETIKAEALEKRASAAKNRAEAEKIMAECLKQRAEAEKMRLENEKARLEIKKEKIELAFEIINRVCNRLSEVEKFSYLIKLYPLLDEVLASEVEIQVIDGSGN